MWSGIFFFLFPFAKRVRLAPMHTQKTYRTKYGTSFLATGKTQVRTSIAAVVKLFYSVFHANPDNTPLKPLKCSDRLYILQHHLHIVRLFGVIGLPVCFSLGKHGVKWPHV